MAVAAVIENERPREKTRWDVQIFQSGKAAGGWRVGCNDPKPEAVPMRADAPKASTAMLLARSKALPSHGLHLCCSCSDTAIDIAIEKQQDALGHTGGH